MWIETINNDLEIYNHEVLVGYPFFNRSWAAKFSVMKGDCVYQVSKIFESIKSRNLSHKQNKIELINLLNLDMVADTSSESFCVEMFSDRSAENEPLYFFVIMLAKICAEKDESQKRNIINSLLDYLETK